MEFLTTVVPTTLYYKQNLPSGFPGFSAISWVVRQPIEKVMIFSWPRLNFAQFDFHKVVLQYQQNYFLSFSVISVRFYAKTNYYIILSDSGPHLEYFEYIIYKSCDVRRLRVLPQNKKYPSQVCVPIHNDFMSDYALNCDYGNVTKIKGTATLGAFVVVIRSQRHESFVTSLCII